MAVRAMDALKPTPCFLGGSFMPRGENGVFMIVIVEGSADSLFLVCAVWS